MVVTIAPGHPVVAARGPLELNRAAGGWGRWQFPFLGRLADGRLHASFSIEPDSYGSYGMPMGHAYSSDHRRSWRMGAPLAAHQAEDGVLLPNGDRLKPVQLPSARAEELDLPRSVCDFVYSYGYRRSLYRAERLPRELAGWRFSRLTAGGSRWVDETALVRIPGELRCVVVEKRGAARARTGVPTLPFPQGKLRVAPDGSLWAATHEWRLFEVRPRYAPLLLRSVDDGHTWELRGEARYQGDEWDDPLAAPRDGFIEPDWCFMPDGSAVCLMRTKNGHGHGPLYLARSVDGCRSRSRPQVFDSFGKMPQLLTLCGGVTVASYGASGGPGYFVVRATVDPAGRTWQAPAKSAVSPAAHGAWGACGHTEIVAMDDHSALVVYSDLNYPDAQGARRKTSLVRGVSVTP